jgi:hypothetical protein
MANIKVLCTYKNGDFTWYNLYIYIHMYMHTTTHTLSQSETHKLADICISSLKLLLIYFQIVMSILAQIITYVFHLLIFNYSFPHIVSIPSSPFSHSITHTVTHTDILKVSHYTIHSYILTVETSCTQNFIVHQLLVFHSESQWILRSYPGREGRNWDYYSY